MVTLVVYNKAFQQTQSLSLTFLTSASMFSKICLLALALVAAAEVRVPFTKGPTKPLEGYDASDCTRPGDIIPDEENMCWYHQCVQTSEVTYKLIARSCPLGTRVRYTISEPVETAACKHNYIGRYTNYFECAREADSVPNPKPFCAHQLDCKNGGTLRVQDDFCWCECPTEWGGDSDCSKRVHQVLLDNPAEPRSKCVDGSDGIDHCARAGGCLNGGTCVNQCGGFHCFCPSPFRNGKRCEDFTCNKNNECFNGGTCYRGSTDDDETRRCFCVPGFYGFRCEHFKCNSNSECLNGGICSASQTCICPGGFSGVRCEDFRCRTHDHCLNGGRCTTIGTCNCPSGFSGFRCGVQLLN